MILDSDLNMTLSSFMAFVTFKFIFVTLTTFILT